MEKRDADGLLLADVLIVPVLNDDALCYPKTPSLMQQPVLISTDLEVTLIG